MRTITYLAMLLAVLIMFPFAVLWIGCTCIAGNVARVILTFKL